MAARYAAATRGESAERRSLSRSTGAARRALQERRRPDVPVPRAIGLPLTPSAVDPSLRGAGARGAG